MRRWRTLFGILCFAAAFLAPARAADAGAPDAGDDPFARYLFPPEKVLGRAQELGLDDAQKKAIRAEVHKAQSRFVDLKFDLQSEAEKMSRLLQEKPVDEGSVLAEVDRILGLEREIKKTHIALLVRIKNVLTAAQQTKLEEGK